MAEQPDHPRNPGADSRRTRKQPELCARRAALPGAPGGAKRVRPPRNPWGPNRDHRTV